MLLISRFEVFVYNFDPTDSDVFPQLLSVNLSKAVVEDAIALEADDAMELDG